MDEDKKAKHLKVVQSALRKLGVDPKKALESPDWWRFEVRGIPLQAGIAPVSSDPSKGHWFKVVSTICATSTDVDRLPTILAACAAASKGMRSGSFVEADNYIYFKAVTAFPFIQRDMALSTLQASVDAAESPAAKKLRVEFEPVL